MNFPTLLQLHAVCPEAMPALLASESLQDAAFFQACDFDEAMSWLLCVGYLSRLAPPLPLPLPRRRRNQRTFYSPAPDTPVARSGAHDDVDSPLAPILTMWQMLNPPRAPPDLTTHTPKVLPPTRFAHDLMLPTPYPSSTSTARLPPAGLMKTTTVFTEMTTTTTLTLTRIRTTIRTLTTSTTLRTWPGSDRTIHTTPLCRLCFRLSLRLGFAFSPG
ncbi:hypothetical protein ColLi_12695 [Colletotrichum liriopes]|uniref:Uncharacterized protein n=1 Tax=Colletotrichum liriopes TaxID=708192 RepID=A0AA37GZE0_9PEZI|nr:hypothetical protein ColLi_12695 [Colletotrichum liriopes]